MAEVDELKVIDGLIEGVDTSVVPTDVEMTVAKGVLDNNSPTSDFKLAGSALEKCISAGIDPEVVCYGLKLGHGYEVEEITTSQVIKPQQEDLVGEFIKGEDAFVYYEYQDRPSENKRLLEGVEDYAVVVKQTGLVKPELGQKKAVKLTGVLKAKPVVSYTFNKR